jgi:hypothetical protein
VSADDAVEAGRAAWARLKINRRSWDDWLCFAKALQIGKVTVMVAAKTNRPVGSRYNRMMADWLGTNGLSDVVAQERNRLLKIMDNLAAIETWRDRLPEAKRRSMNHPNAIWSCWQRAVAPTPAEPRAPVRDRARPERRRSARAKSVALLK